MAEPLAKAPIHSMALSPTDVMRDMVCEDPDSTRKDPCGDAGSQPRKALGDVTNAWSFVPRTKAGDLGVETFKKFLEKKRRERKEGRGRLRLDKRPASKLRGDQTTRTIWSAILSFLLPPGFRFSSFASSVPRAPGVAQTRRDSETGGF